MKSLIQRTDDYKLYLQIDPVEVTDGVRIQLLSYLTTAAKPEESQTRLDWHMSRAEFAVLCRELNIYSMKD